MLPPLRQLIEVRHYDITVKAAGTSKTVGRLLSSTSVVPDLGKLDDISDLLLK